MKIKVLLFLVVFSFAGGVAPLCASSMTGNFNLLVGRKYLKEDDWNPLEDQGEVGIQLDFRKKEWPVNIAIDLLTAADKETLGNGDELKGRTNEFDFGVRKIWQDNRTLRPFVGGGLGFISAHKERTGTNGFDDSDSAVGLWLCGGLYWTIADVFNIGFEARLSRASVTLLEDKVQAGGNHLGILLGYHFD
jgi:hypothetical protein